jgi:hypothetical protein
VAIAVALVGLGLVRKRATKRPVIITLNGNGYPRLHGVPFGSTNVRDAIFHIMARLGLKAGVAAPTGISNLTQMTNFLETMSALEHAGLLNTNPSVNPNE